MHIIIVGAGILGASTAYHLAKKGHQVTIIDRGDEGQATAAAAGMICPWISQRRNKAWYTLVKNGAAYYPELINELEKDGETKTGYRRVGAIRLHPDEKKLLETKERAEIKRQTAPEIGKLSLLSPQETKELFPLLDTSYSGLYVEGAARVDGKRLRDALLFHAEKLGAQFIAGDASLLQEASRVIGAKVAGSEILGDQVIVTAGAWARSLLDTLNIDVNVREQKAQIIHLQLPEKNSNRWPVIFPPGHQYLLAFEQGRFVVGSSQEDDAGFDTRITAGPIHEILTKVLQLAPALEHAEWIETRVGFRPFTPMSLPMFGKIPGIHDLFFANGLGATGLTMGPYLGSVLANVAVGDSIDLDLSPYKIQK